MKLKKQIINSKRNSMRNNKRNSKNELLFRNNIIKYRIIIYNI